MLNGSKMKIAEDLILGERHEKVRKLRDSLHDFLILEAEGHKVMPTDACVAVVLEAAACVCAAAAVHKDPSVALHFLNVFEEKVNEGMVRVVDQLLHGKRRSAG